MNQTGEDWSAIVRLLSHATRTPLYLNTGLCTHVHPSRHYEIRLFTRKKVCGRSLMMTQGQARPTRCSISWPSLAANRTPTTAPLPTEAPPRNAGWTAVGKPLQVGPGNTARDLYDEQARPLSAGTLRKIMPGTRSPISRALEKVSLCPFDHEEVSS